MQHENHDDIHMTFLDFLCLQLMNLISCRFFHVGINLSKENLPTTLYKTTLIPIQHSMSKTYFKIALLDFFWDIVEYKVISSHILVDMTDFFLGEIHFSSKFSSIPLILPIFCLFIYDSKLHTVNLFAGTAVRYINLGARPKAKTIVHS